MAMSPSIWSPLGLTLPTTWTLTDLRRQVKRRVSKPNDFLIMCPSTFLVTGAAKEDALWPRYTVDERLLLDIRSRERKIIKDDYRANAIEWVGLDPEFNWATRR